MQKLQLTTVLGISKSTTKPLALGFPRLGIYSALKFRLLKSLVLPCSARSYLLADDPRAALTSTI